VTGEINGQNFLVEEGRAGKFEEGITFTREEGGQELYSIYSDLDINFPFNPNKMKTSLPDSFFLFIFA
jgi:hypothetical protein